MSATTTVSTQENIGSTSKVERLNTPLTRGSLLLFTLALVAACSLYFTNLGDMPLFSPDEALYAEPAREMLETGEYVTTYLNYQVRYTKPPLFIWSIAASMKAFCVSEFASRFVSAVSGVILVGITYLFADKFFGRRSATLAALTLMLAPMYLAISRLAITDVPLALLISGALMSLFYGFEKGEHRFKWYAYVLLGMGVMTKGPVAILLPGLILFAYHLLMGEIKRAWVYYRPFAGLGIIALIALPWFVLETWVTRGEYFDAFIMRENLQRFTGVVDHKYPWWYHLAAMFGGFFPYSLFLPFAWLAAFKLKASGPLNYLNKIRSLGSAQKAAIFSTVTALVILAFFSASVSKLLPYTLPAFPFLAISVGFYLNRMAENNKWVPAVIGYGAFTILCAGSYSLLPYLEAKLRYCPPELITFLPGYITFMVVTGLVPLIVAAFRKVYASFIVFALLLMGGILGFGPPLQHIFADSWEEPLKAFVQYAAVSDRPIYIANLRKPSSTFYALRKIEHEESVDMLLQRLKTVDSAYIIGRQNHKDIYLKEKGYKLVAEKGRFILLDYKQGARK